MTISDLAEIYSQNDRYSLVNATGRMFVKPIAGWHEIAITGMTEKIGRRHYCWSWRNPVFDRNALVAQPQTMTYRWRRI